MSSNGKPKPPTAPTPQLPITVPRRTRRRWTALAAGAVLAVAAVLSAAPTASAASSTTCTGGSTITYQPGLTYTPRTVAYTETDSLNSCLSTDPAITSGTSGSSIVLDQASCLAPPSIVRDPAFTITWNTGEQSVVDLTFTEVVLGGTEQVTGTGPVISGKFPGGNATVVWLYPVLNLLQCATGQGVTTQNGTLVGQITSP
ncbi:hypothetical protein ACFXGA_09760 [Actinosynnema sp. NPDC059335]|uniref:hypothetical protein n=1 Tax=Actinosynnema sp. NPDC059335 TaxID=3346804 RepID=UPI0036719690